MNDPVALVINAGSSSLKAAVADRSGVSARHTVERLDGSPPGYERAIDECLLAFGLTGEPAVIGHRIVHGGSRFGQPVRIDADSIAAFSALVPLAPLHQPPGLAAVAAARRRFPSIPQVACFDTAFHATMPAVNTRFAIPRELHDSGVRRYGFHGLSYEYLTRELRKSHPDVADKRVVIAHLGSGASLCGVVAGRSVATTMGMTPLDGVPMGSRPGRIDPGVLVHLLRTPTGARTEPFTLAQLDDLLNHGCGLTGLSGGTADVRDLEASREPAAAEALECFAAAVAREIAGLCADIGGLDAVVFSAGIGEHSARVRADVMKRLAFLGVDPDPAANDRNDTMLHMPSSRVAVLRIPTDEAAVIAVHALQFLVPREKT
jgi:acetate kinase